MCVCGVGGEGVELKEGLLMRACLGHRRLPETL